ncbi:hypothetical protein COCSADRAFT_253402 [Bipolaris sorokiniana ND90Pr]|uniref:Uncharacterized protein n=1 Tax=Cochliobolus sativus (strain ND90Pr / ATCC 201652) TaxID=665912 RepID=M2SB74_COCSN|nr:uncharacterized protein COCSADRAFT_253402 [Bipolaris sorokiniana ND90Pr]EMD59740.1 hypothetical protein COCSADRAFT_253402 [Bipolaris sorokiniana ND90Pr]
MEPNRSCYSACCVRRFDWNWNRRGFLVNYRYFQIYRTYLWYNICLPYLGYLTLLCSKIGTWYNHVPLPRAYI